MKRRFGSPDREWLHPEHFNDEPVYCEAPHNPDDVLYSGSDDEAYHSPAERRIRYETQANRFLEGKPVLLLSASLRGPFDRISGWVNPWRSGSASRAKAAQKARAPAAKKAKTVEQNESSGIFESSSFHHDGPESSAALPRNTQTFTPPKHMDGDTFHRVRDWCHRVVAESEIPTSPSQRASQAEPTSADSRRATQQTVRRQSGLTLDTIDDEPGCLTPRTPSVRSDERNRGACGTSRQNDVHVTPSLPARTRSLSKHAPVSQNASSPPSLPFATDVPPMEKSDPQTVPEESAPDSTPAGQAFAARKLVRKESLGTRASTPHGIVPDATALSALQRTQTSARTDGSFHYRPKDAREKRRSLGKSKLAGPPSAPSDIGEDQVNRISPERAVEDPGTAEATSAMPSRVDRMATGSEPALTADEIAPGGQDQGIPGEMPVLQPSQSIRKPTEEASEQSESADDDAADTASQIDGPTLVPSDSQSVSEHPSEPSFAHFSCEKHSQDVISESMGLPRRLLWPKRRRESRDSLPVFGLETAHIPVSNPGVERHSPSPSRPRTPKDAIVRPTEEIEVIQPAEEAQAFIDEDRLDVVDEEGERDVEPLEERAAESETASEAEDEEMDATHQVEAEAQAGAGDAEADVQPAASPAPQPQSPWIQDDEPLPSELPRSPEDQQNAPAEASGIQSTPPKATQSPWTKQTEILPGASVIPQPPHPYDNAKLSFIASQALEQTTSQSPWARGDSQLQLPEVRLFNPLSSPANSHVLPTADATSHSPAPPAEDTDLCNPQLQPHHPSTPTTKRSGLPSPDFTLSVKSFKDFMTPSPRPSSKRRRISTAAEDDHLPSTQALVDPATSNPWTRPPTAKPNKKKKKREQQPRQKKRVSWAPLPDDDPGTDIVNTSSASPYTSELTTPLPHKQQPGPSHRIRASSPPPSILFLSVSKLPGTNQKFGKHFAAVAGRRVGMGVAPLQQLGNNNNHNRATRETEKKRKGTVGLLPSASQQVCGSPAVGGMAEAFLRADATSSAGAAGRAATFGAAAAGKVALMSGDGGENIGGKEDDEVGEDITTGEVEASGDGDVNDMMLEAELAMDADRQGDEAVEDEEEEEDEMTQDTQDGVVLGEEESPVDEVSAVMENLDDFLGGNWDLEADLAKARAETERESRRVSSNGGFGMGGLMDVGVWD